MSGKYGYNTVSMSVNSRIQKVQGQQHDKACRWHNFSNKRQTGHIAEKMSGSHSASLHSSTGHLTLNTRLNLAQAMKHRRKP